MDSVFDEIRRVVIESICQLCLAPFAIFLCCRYFPLLFLLLLSLVFACTLRVPPTHLPSGSPCAYLCRHPIQRPQLLATPRNFPIPSRLSAQATSDPGSGPRRPRQADGPAEVTQSLHAKKGGDREYMYHDPDHIGKGDPDPFMV